MNNNSRQQLRVRRCKSHKNGHSWKELKEVPNRAHLAF